MSKRMHPTFVTYIQHVHAQKAGTHVTNVKNAVSARALI